MILVDANLLVYAHNTDSVHHHDAHQWLDEALSGRPRVAIPWESSLAFVRLTTNPRIFPSPLTVPEAWRQVEEWLSASPVWVPTPTDRHQEVLASLIPQVTKATLVPDAHLAALAVQYGLIVASADGDFARFAGVRWFNPLAT